jgi:hypothetical protein
MLDATVRLRVANKLLLEKVFERVLLQPRPNAATTAAFSRRRTPFGGKKSLSATY